MAPFGKNFLKARLKSRSKDADPPPGKEIQVTVCGEEKIVCGVTKHTTCLDMVQALLDDHRTVPESRRKLHGEPHDFCLVERWKGFERALPPLTRILRLWSAWGDQRPNVHFLLFKTSDFVTQPGKKSAKPRGARPKRFEHGRQPQALPSEKQKRVVRKAFRKLEKLHKENKTSHGSEEIDRMVQLILNQDHAIREQIQRMRTLDSEIERIEVCFRQDELDLEAQACGGWSFDIEEQLDRLLFTSDGVERLDAQVLRHHELILKLSLEIDEELRREATPQKNTSAKDVACDPPADDQTLAAEVERLQGEIERSLLAGVSLQNQTSEMDKQLQLFDAALSLKDDECWQLAEHLDSLRIADSAQTQEIPVPAVSGCGVSRALRLKDSNLGPLDLTDTDSDTGISSTHSQDSLSPGLDFPPPLDTDV